MSIFKISVFLVDFLRIFLGISKNNKVRPSLALAPLPITPNILENNETPKSRREKFKCKLFSI